MTCSYKIVIVFFFFQAEDGIRDLVRSRGLGDVYKRQIVDGPLRCHQLTVLLSSQKAVAQVLNDLRRQPYGLSLIHI